MSKAGDTTGELSLPIQQADDAALLRATRQGERAAFSELWKRYSRAAHAIASGFSGSLDPEDVVAEAYTKIFATLMRGGGPEDDFLAYLAATIRNTARRWGTASKEFATETLDALPAQDSSHGSFENLRDDQLIMKRAFAALPERWRQIIWETEVEGHTPRELAQRRGTSANAVSALLYRAREGLSEAWIAQHLRRAASSPDCQKTLALIPKYVRQRISKQERILVERHLPECALCAGTLDEAGRVAHRLRSLLLPGIPASAGAGAEAGLPPPTVSPTAPTLASPSAATPATTPHTPPAAGGEASQQGWPSAASAHPPLLPGTVRTLWGAAGKLMTAALASAGLAVSLSGLPPFLAPDPSPAPSAPRHGGPAATPEPSQSPGSHGPAEPQPRSSVTQEHSHPSIPPPDAAPALLTRVLPADPERAFALASPSPGAYHPHTEGSSGPSAPRFDRAPEWIFAGAETLLTGTADPRSTVVTYISGQFFEFWTAEAPVDSTGRWAVSLTELPDGPFTVRAWSQQGDTLRSALTSSPFHRLSSSQIPPPDILSLDTAGGRYAPIVLGQALPGAAVELRINARSFRLRASTHGTWRFYDPDAVTVGRNTISASQRSPLTQAVSQPSVPQTFSLETPSITGSIAPSGALMIRAEGRADWGVLVQEGQGRFSHFLMAPNPDHPISPHANDAQQTPVTGRAVTARYSSADRHRLGARSQPFSPPLAPGSPEVHPSHSFETAPRRFGDKPPRPPLPQTSAEAPQHTPSGTAQ